MSSLNQAFIKAYGKDGPAPNPAQPATVTTTPPAVVETDSSAKVLGSWYSADTWFRAESAHAPVAAPSAPAAPVAPPHVPFTAGYQAPSPQELGRLGDARLARHLAEESEYSLLPPEPVAKPELVVIDEPPKMIVPPVAVVEAPLAPVVEAPAPVVMAPAPVVMAPAPVVVAPPAPAPVAEVEVAPAMPAPIAPKSAPVADAFALHEMFAPVQIGGSWEQAYGVIPPVSTLTAAVAPTEVSTKPKTKEAPPAPQAVEKVVEKPVTPPAPIVVAKTPEVAPAPVIQPVAPSVPQMRLDAAQAQPVPKPHVAVAPTAPVITAPAPVITAPAPVKVETPAPVIKAPPAPAVVAPPPAAVAPPPAVVAPKAPLPSGPIQPAWEVDRFQWPEHCQQLMSAESKYMSDVGQRLSSAAKDGLSILAITSTRRGEGRTTLALCLAKAAAAAGVKVALVDGDGDNPQLVNELGVEASCGWHDVVQGKQPLSEAAILSIEDKFTFFPWTTAGALKSLNDPQVTRVLKAIASEHHLVILDLGPAPGRETRLFEDGENCPVDAAILVRDVRWTSALEAQRVASQLQSAGVGSVGLAENFGPRTSQAS